VSTSRSAVCKRASQRRARYSSVSSSVLSSEEEEEELTEVEKRHGKRRELERHPSDSEDNWLYARRSCRQRKQISYKFEEYDQLICGAIEDDVKEIDSTCKCCVFVTLSNRLLCFWPMIQSAFCILCYFCILLAHIYLINSCLSLCLCVYWICIADIWIFVRIIVTLNVNSY